MAGLPEILLIVLKDLHDGLSRGRLHFAKHLIARLGHVGLRLECLENELAFLIRAFFKGEPPLDLGSHYLHLSLREQFSSHLLPGGGPTSSRAIKFIRSDDLIGISTAHVGLINDQIHSVASSEAQQALADYVGLFGRGRSPRTQIFFSDGRVLLDLLVLAVQRQDHLINEA